MCEVRFQFELLEALRTAAIPCLTLFLLFAECAVFVFGLSCYVSSRGYGRGCWGELHSIRRCCARTACCWKQSVRVARQRGAPRRLVHLDLTSLPWGRSGRKGKEATDWCPSPVWSPREGGAGCSRLCMSIQAYEHLPLCKLRAAPLREIAGGHTHLYFSLHQIEIFVELKSGSWILNWGFTCVRCSTWLLPGCKDAQTRYKCADVKMAHGWELGSWRVSAWTAELAGG